MVSTMATKTAEATAWPTKQDVRALKAALTELRRSRESASAEIKALRAQIEELQKLLDDVAEAERAAERTILSTLRRDPRIGQIAVHFCGSVAKEAAGVGPDDRNTWWDELKGGRARVQLNIDSGTPVSRTGIDFMSVGGILQVRDHAMVPVASHLAARVGVAPLFDASCGTGKEIDVNRAIGLARRWRDEVKAYADTPGWGLAETWGLAAIGRDVDKDGLVGFAGGINPDNVERILRQLQQAWSGPFWIDMESGVRSSSLCTNTPPELVDYLDFEKVEKVLAICDRVSKQERVSAPEGWWRPSPDMPLGTLGGQPVLGDILAQTISDQRAASPKTPAAAPAPAPPTETPADPPPPAPPPLDYKTVVIAPPDDAHVRTCRLAVATVDDAQRALRQAETVIKQQIDRLSEERVAVHGRLQRAELVESEIRLLLRVVNYPDPEGRPVIRGATPPECVFESLPRVLVTNKIVTGDDVNVLRKLMNCGLLTTDLTSPTVLVKLSAQGAYFLARRGVPKPGVRAE
jgi:hypothetical protein